MSPTRFKDLGDSAGSPDHDDDSPGHSPQSFLRRQRPHIGHDRVKVGQMRTDANVPSSLGKHSEIGWPVLRKGGEYVACEQTPASDNDRAGRTYYKIQGFCI